MTVVVPNYTWKGILDDLIDTGNLLDGAVLHLFSNNFSPTKDSVVADFTEATFTGYADFGPVAWGAAGYKPDGNAVTVTISHQFQAGSPLTSPGVIYGWYITDTGGTNLLASAKYDAPVNIALPSQIFEAFASFPIAYP